MNFERRTIQPTDLLVEAELETDPTSKTNDIVSRIGSIDGHKINCLLQSACPLRSNLWCMAECLLDLNQPKEQGYSFTNQD